MTNEPNELDARPQSRREWSGWLRSIVMPLAILAVIIGGLLAMAITYFIGMAFGAMI